MTRTKRGVIIQGSSRSKGDTNQLVRYLLERTDWGFVDLKNLDIAPFDYDFRNQGDDFLPTIRRLIKEYDCFVFATPVYWYTMSATMKVFFDRISDLLKIDKPTGRKLRGKQMGVLSCASDRHVSASFYEPFQLSADYLGIEYIGDIHGWIEADGSIPLSVQQVLDNFASIAV